MKRYLSTIILSVFSLITFAQDVEITGIAKNTGDSVIVFRRNDKDALTGEKNRKRYKANINQIGEFKISLPENSISEWVVECEDAEKIIHLKKGDNLHLIFDLKPRQDALVAVGKNADDFNFLNHISRKVNEMYKQDFYKKAQESSVKDAISMRKEKMAFQIAILEEYWNTHKMSEAYYQWLKTNYEYEPYERTFIENIITNKIKFSADDEALFVQKGINNDYAAKNSAIYNDVVNFYMHHKINGFTFPLRTTDFFDFGIKNLSGLTKQVFLTRQMYNLSKTPDSLYKPVYVKYLKAVDNKELILIVQNARKKYLKEKAESEQSKENISKNASLNEIFKLYKGKVIYLDFWASWCGPCKAEMSNASKLKSKLQGKNIVFLYLGYNDTKENWLAARKQLEIAGEHYLLSPKLIKEVRDVFNVTTIPHYAIIDKEGNIIDKNATRPAQSYEQLLKLTESK